MDPCLVEESNLINGSDEVFSGQISQYSFFDGLSNELEWEIDGGEVLWTSGFDNSIAVQWNSDTDQGIVIVAAYNDLGELICHTMNIAITPSNIGLHDNENLIVDLFVYPNPFTDKLNLVFNEQDIEHVTIVDQLGKEVYKHLHSSIPTDGDIILSLENLAPGSYFLRLYINGRIQTIPISKSK